MKFFTGFATFFTRPIPFYWIVLLFLTLPNVPLLLASHALGTMEHGVINIEILLIGAAAIFLPRSAVFALLVVDFLADFAYGVCFTYQFSLDNFLSSLRYLPLLPAGRIFEGAFLVAVGILMCAVLAVVRPRPQERRRIAVTLVACVILLSPIDILGGQNPIWHKDVALIPGRVVRSPMLTLGVREAAFALVNHQSSEAKDAFMASASASLLSYVNQHSGSPGSAGFTPPDVVLIVVESWGMPLDSRLAQALTASYDDPQVAASYNVTYGAAPFSGLTVPGEARELCQSTMGFAILHLSPDQASRCLPAILHRSGYRNIAVHGYVGQMFYRSAWYPKLGFDETRFGPELEKIGLPRCRGAFPGVCDTAIAQWMGTSLLGSASRGSASNKPRFIYWVTLNSHVPEPARPDLADDGVCATQPALNASAALCSWFRLVRAVHQSVSQLATKVNDRPTVFVLVGDHAPPFGDPRLCNQFSSAQVPFVMLTPRQPGPLLAVRTDSAPRAQGNGPSDRP